MTIKIKCTLILLERQAAQFRELFPQKTMLEKADGLEIVEIS